MFCFSFFICFFLVVALVVSIYMGFLLSASATLCDARQQIDCATENAIFFSWGPLRKTFLLELFKGARLLPDGSLVPL